MVTKPHITRKIIKIDREVDIQTIRVKGDLLVFRSDVRVDGKSLGPSEGFCYTDDLAKIKTTGVPPLHKATVGTMLWFPDDELDELGKIGLYHLGDLSSYLSRYKENLNVFSYLANGGKVENILLFDLYRGRFKRATGEIFYAPMPIKFSILSEFNLIERDRITAKIEAHPDVTKIPERVSTPTRWVWTPSREVYEETFNMSMLDIILWTDHFGVRIV